MTYFRFALVLAGALLVPAAVFAAAPDADTTGVVAEATPTAVVAAPLRLPNGERLLTLTASSDDTAPQVILPHAQTRDPRRGVLLSLDAATGVVQGYDGFLTMRVVRAGGIETNPLIKPIASHQGALMAVKVSAAVSTVIGAELLWRNDHRIGAILASLAANSAMVMVARHNAKVLAKLEGR